MVASAHVDRRRPRRARRDRADPAPRAAQRRRRGGGPRSGRGRPCAAVPLLDLDRLRSSLRHLRNPVRQLGNGLPAPATRACQLDRQPRPRGVLGGGDRRSSGRRGDFRQDPAAVDLPLPAGADCRRLGVCGTRIRRRVRCGGVRSCRPRVLRLPAAEHRYGEHRNAAIRRDRLRVDGGLLHDGVRNRRIRGRSAATARRSAALRRLPRRDRDRGGVDPARQSAGQGAAQRSGYRCFGGSSVVGDTPVWLGTERSLRMIMVPRNDPQRAARCDLRTPRIASRAARIVLALLCLTCSATAFPRDGAALAVQRVAMIGFTVSDMDRSVSFYSDVLSFEKVADFQVTGPLYDHLQGVFGSRVRIVHMRLGDQIVELTQYVAPPDGRPIPVPSRSNDLWFEHMAIVVSDMDQAYETLQRHQIRQISPEPQTIPASNVPAAGIKAIKFRDPDDHDLELLWFPPDKGATRWHQAGNRLFLGIDHTAITVGDTAASLAFYSDQLGMTVAGGSLNVGPTQEYLDNVFGARVRVTALTPPDVPPHVEFLQYETPPGGRPMPLDTQANDLWHWQTSLLVDDVQAAADALRAAGVRFVSPDVTTVSETALGFSRAVMVRDPDGHAMRLVQR